MPTLFPLSRIFSSQAAREKKLRSSNPFFLFIKNPSWENAHNTDGLITGFWANRGSWESLSAPQPGRGDLHSPHSLCVQLNVALKELKKAFKLYKRNKYVTGALAGHSGRVALGFENTNSNPLCKLHLGGSWQAEMVITSYDRQQQHKQGCISKI